MTCLKTILESSISELVARRNMKLSSHQDKSLNLEIAEEMIEITRRPYLSSCERSLTESLPEAALKEYFKPGEFIHVPMTKEEKSIIDQFVKFFKKKRAHDENDLSSEDYETISEFLPGRRLDDIQNFLADLEGGVKLSDSILVFASEPISNYNAPPISWNNNSNDWAKMIQKQFSIIESSGSIVQIACRSGIKGSSILVGACATTDDERYNRIGELIFGFKGPTNYDVLILDGHKKQKYSAEGHSTIRQTVSSVIYDPLTDCFISGGYDGNVVTWMASNGSPVMTIGSHQRPINSISCHSSTPIIAYGCQNGGLYFSNINYKTRPTPIFIKPKAKDIFSNTVDSVLIPSTGLKQNLCYAGIGYLQSSASGVIEAWDLNTGAFACSSENLVDGFACMSVSACGKWLAAGTGGISSERALGDGILRIMDINQDLKVSMSINTKKFDMDSVSFCPKTQLLFLAESSDNSISVYDLRFPSEPIFNTSHGDSRVDSVVAHSWVSNGNILATGGFDGQLKLWDCNNGFSALNAFEFNSSISCITYSEADHCIWVGADNGGVYMLASPGFLGDNHPVTISGRCVF